MGQPPMQPPMGQPQPPMGQPQPPMGQDPMMQPEMADVTQITAIAGEEVSEIDKIEGILKGLALENPNIKVKRKSKGGK